MTVLRAPSRVVVRRSTAARQLDLLLVSWLCLGAAALGVRLLKAYSESEGVPPLPELSPAGWAAIFALGTAAMLIVRWWFARREFRYVSDGVSFLFLAQPRVEPVLLRREEVLAFREDLEGLAVETPHGPVRMAGDPEALLLVNSQLLMWRAADGHPLEPPHTPPFAR